MSIPEEFVHLLIGDSAIAPGSKKLRSTPIRLLQQSVGEVGWNPLGSHHETILVDLELASDCCDQLLTGHFSSGLHFGQVRKRNSYILSQGSER